MANRRRGCTERIFRAVIETVKGNRRPATRREVQEFCAVSSATARRELERLRGAGRLWRVPIIDPDQEGGKSRRGYLPTDDRLVGNIAIGECDVDGCIAVPVIMLTRGGRRWKLCRRCMRGFDEATGRGFGGPTDERAYSLSLSAGRTSSALFCGGWEPPTGDD